VAQGIGKGSYVPVLMDRSIELVISVLAIIKVGAAFVPLDIDWPQARLQQILQELGSPVVLVNKVTDRQTELDLSVLMVDRSTPHHFQPNLNLQVGARDPIYAIYTSGSTGTPKAVVVPHQGIINRFLWMNEFFGSESATATLQTTRHIYDSAVWQLFWPLINGGKTVIPSPDMTMSAEEIASLIYEQGLTIVDFVPSVFNTLVPQLTTNREVQQKLTSLQTVIVGGEEIAPATTYTFMNHFPNVRVVNLYGPTEASIGCICYEVTGREGISIPIGKPIANVQVLILDRQQQLVPVGVAGEIYLTGSCLALGYLHDEPKTKAAFIDNPFREMGYEKLYKTGDLACYLPDGNIKFLGRIDHQVKIRGIRVELGEIEALLSQHPDVAQAVAIVREDLPDRQQLVGYVVSNRERVPTTSELRHFLKQKLPDYMVPSTFMTIESIPLTAGGKMNKRALPVPELGRSGLEVSFILPRTPTEKILAQLWTEVLGVEQVGMQDNFFELGGHSLLATQLVSRIAQTFAANISLRDLFTYSNIADLAELVVARQLDRADSPAIAEILSQVGDLSDDEVKQLLHQ
jgi:amino acid adenylation domain-containing protein